MQEQYVISNQAFITYSQINMDFLVSIIPQ